MSRAAVASRLSYHWIGDQSPARIHSAGQLHAVPMASHSPFAIARAIRAASSPFFRVARELDEHRRLFSSSTLSRRDQHALVDLGLLRQVDVLRIVAHDDVPDPEARGEQHTFLGTGRSGARCHRHDLRNDPVVG